MSADEHDNDPVAERITDGMGAFADATEPNLAASWARIEAQLGAGDATERATSRLASSASQRFLVAAAIAATIFLAAGATIVARNADDGLGVAATPSPSSLSNAAPIPRPTSIVALTTSGSLVELDLDGRMKRVIFSTTNPMEQLRGKPSVGPDGTIYVEQGFGPCSGLPSVGRIAGIPIGGGEVNVIAKAGLAPAVSPDGRSLAFVGPPDGAACYGRSTDWPVYVVDLASGSTQSIPLTVEQDPTHVPVGAVEPEWITNDRLMVLGQQADHSCPAGAPRAACAIREYVEVTRSGAPPRPIATAARPGGQVDPADVLQDSTADSFVITRPSSDAPEELQLVRASFDTGGIVSVRSIVVRDGSAPEPPRPSFELPTGSGSMDILFHSAIDAAADGSLVLLATWRQLHLWDGQRLRKLADNITAAAFVISADPVAEPAAETTAGSTPGSTPAGSSDGTSATTTDAEWYPRPADAAAIKEAYDLTFRGDFSRLEGGEEIRPATQQGAAENPDISTDVEVRINGIHYTDADHADVDFEVLKDGLLVTAPSTGGAMRVGGTWFMTKATMCELLARGGIACPGEPIAP